jgi:hypothetical protein
MEGQGTTESPYTIEVTDQFVLLGRASILWDRHFVLGADINLDPNLADGGIFAQAVIPAFMGIFDGKSHVISNLVIEGGSLLGLFGVLASGAEVKDLGVVDVNITGTGVCVGGMLGSNYGEVTRCYSTGTVSGNWDVGGLMGENEGNVTYCYSTCAVSGTDDLGGLVGISGGNVTLCYSSSAVNGSLWVGGLIGENLGDLIRCYSSGVVSGDWYVGGLGGYNEYCGYISQCYSSNAVNGNIYIGGLIGSNVGIIINSYSKGSVTGQSSVGGLIGKNGDVWLGECSLPSTISNCYSVGTVTGETSIGGLLGKNVCGEILSCFWDIETSGKIISSGGESKTTAEMKTLSTFTSSGWDFVGETANGTEDIWWILEGRDYPRLWWEAAEQ